MSDMPVNPKEKKKGKLEDYELDNHVRTLTEAHSISCCPDTMKQVQKHAKKKKMALNAISKMAKEDKDEDDMEIKSIDQIRSRRKKLKDKMTKVE